jgi:hypothetical protein
MAKTHRCTPTSTCFSFVADTGVVATLPFSLSRSGSQIADASWRSSYCRVA